MKTQKSIEEIVKKKESIEKELLSRPGVTGVDVGYKYVNGKRTDEFSIRVHVKKKKKDKDVPAKEMVPAEVDGIKTDVIEREYFPQAGAAAKAKVEDVSAVQPDTTHYPTLLGGISIGPDRAVGGYVFAGTLGGIVQDNTNNGYLMLSNFHVMCIDNGWKAGDQIDQPSLIDTGTNADGVGTIVRAVLNTSVDCAVADISGRGFTTSIVDIGNVNGTSTATMGANARKRGRTTLLTYGSVDGVSATVNIDYGAGIGVITLTNQISIAPDKTRNPLFSDHGDSGSFVVDDSNNVFGLLFAGSSDGSTVASPIAMVESALNVKVATGVSSTSERFGKRFKDYEKNFKEHIKEQTKEFAKEYMKEAIKDRIKDKEGAFEGGFGPSQNPYAINPLAIKADPQHKIVEVKESLGEGKWSKDIKEGKEGKDKDGKETKDHKDKDGKEHKDHKDKEVKEHKDKDHKEKEKEFGKIERKEIVKEFNKDVETAQVQGGGVTGDPNRFYKTHKDVDKATKEFGKVEIKEKEYSKDFKDGIKDHKEHKDKDKEHKEKEKDYKDGIKEHKEYKEKESGKVEFKEVKEIEKRPFEGPVKPEPDKYLEGPPGGDPGELSRIVWKTHKDQEKNHKDLEHTHRHADLLRKSHKDFEKTHKDAEKVHKDLEATHNPFGPGMQQPEYRHTPVIKDHKGEYDLIEQKFIKDYTVVVGGFGGPGPDPGPEAGFIEARLAQIEQQLGQLTAFIGQNLRPDLSQGALRQEPNINMQDLKAQSEKLGKDAADAMAAKADFDNKVSH